MNRLFLALLIVFPLNLYAQKGLEFVRESIDFSIDSQRFSINGIYHFANGSEHTIHRTILFPFAKNTDSVAVKRVFNLTNMEHIDFKEVENGIVFKLSVPPMDTVKVNIAYSQKTVKENTYILESTQTWGKPLQRADYSLTFDHSVQIDSIYPPPDGMDNHVYFWKKRDFYPHENYRVWID